MHHILINLLANAAQHGGDSGIITIEGTRTREALLLSIRDEGPGLPPGREQRIFETFNEGPGSDREGGSGPGLAIVKGFSEAMGITASAHNHADRRAAFKLSFPVGQQPFRVVEVEPLGRF